MMTQRDKGHHCRQCDAFIDQPPMVNWMSVKTTDPQCDVCRDRRDLVRVVPPSVREFGFKRLCWACRNAMHTYVCGRWAETRTSYGFGACFYDNRDVALWALLHWFLQTQYKRAVRDYGNALLTHENALR